MNTGDKKSEPVKIQYQYVNQPDGSFRKKRIYKTDNQSKKKQKLAYDLVKSSRTVYHPTPAGYTRKKVYFMKKVPKSGPPPAADKDVEPKTDQNEAKETDQTEAKETDQTEAKEPDQTKVQGPDQTKEKEADQNKAKETDQNKEMETGQTEVLAEEKKTENALTNQQLWEQHEQESKAAKMTKLKPPDETDSEDEDDGENGGVHFARD